MDGEKEKLKQKRYNDFYMDVAQRVSQMSHAVRLKVGSILVKEGNIISFGWNGMPSGWDNNCEKKKFIGSYDVLSDPAGEGYTWNDLDEVWERLETRPEVLHSEANCLMKVCKTTNSTKNTTMFCTHAPCIDCAKLIHQAGIRQVYFRNHYRNTNGIDFLTKCGIDTIQVV